MRAYGRLLLSFLFAASLVSATKLPVPFPEVHTEAPPSLPAHPASPSAASAPEVEVIKIPLPSPAVVENILEDAIHDAEADSGSPILNVVSAGPRFRSPLGEVGSFFNEFVKNQKKGFPFPQGQECEEDAHRLCPGVLKACVGSFGCSLQCLTDHAPALSAACARAHPCYPDIDKHCVGIPPGKNQMMACLKKHASSLSEPCLQHHPCLRPHADKSDAKVARDCKHLDYASLGPAPSFVGDISDFLSRLRGQDFFAPLRRFFDVQPREDGPAHMSLPISLPINSPDNEEDDEPVIVISDTDNEPTPLSLGARRHSSGSSSTIAERVRLEREHEQLDEEREELLAERKALEKERKQLHDTKAGSGKNGVKSKTNKQQSASSLSTSAKNKATLPNSAHRSITPTSLALHILVTLSLLIYFMW